MCRGRRAALKRRKKRNLPPADWQGRKAGLVPRPAKRRLYIAVGCLPKLARAPPLSAATARERVRIQQAATGRATVHDHRLAVY